MGMLTKAVITGGGGFLGTYLTGELSSHGYDVSTYGREKPVRADVPYVLGDVRDRERLRCAVQQAEIVFHLAAAIGTEYLMERASEAFDINISGTINVLDLAREMNFAVVDVGVIPDWPSPYMITKKAVARLGVAYYQGFDADVRTLELSHVYGPGQRVKPYFKAIPTFISAALQNRPLTVFGRGSRAMDCLYVTDAAKALRLFGEANGMGGKVVQFGSGEALTVLDLARKIIRATNSRSEIVFAPMRKGEPDDLSEEDTRGVDLSEWIKHFDWTPQTPLDQGLEEAIAWYRSSVSMS